MEGMKGARKRLPWLLVPQLLESKGPDTKTLVSSSEFVHYVRDSLHSTALPPVATDNACLLVQAERRHVRTP